MVFDEIGIFLSTIRMVVTHSGININRSGQIYGAAVTKHFILSNNSAVTSTGIFDFANGVISAINFSTVTLSSPFAFITSLQYSFTSSLHPDFISSSRIMSFSRSFSPVSSSFDNIISFICTSTTFGRWV
jgi:hypothetical protein